MSYFGFAYFNEKKNMNAFLAFYEYLKFPKFEIEDNSDIPTRLQNTVLLFFFIFSLQIIVVFPLLSLMGVENMGHAMETVVDNMSSWSVALLAIVAAPLVEELIFRFPLKNEYLLEMLMLTFYGMIAFLVVQSVASVQLAWGAVFVVLLWRFAAMTIYMQSKNNNGTTHLQWKEKFPIYFYGIAVFFAFVHIFNFELNPNDWWKTPILVMPQFLLALLLGYVRMKYGIIYSILVHAMNNAIPIIAMILFKDMII